MPIRFKILIFVIFYNLLIVSMQIANYYFNINRIDLYVIQEKDLLQKSAQTAVSVSNEYINTTASDYTYYDEMVDFTRSKDTTFAQNNLNQLVGYEYIDYMFVYDSNTELIYKTKKISYIPFENPLSNQVLNNMLYVRAQTQERFKQAYLKQDTAIFFVSAATIHPAVDKSRLIPPSGVLVLAKYLGKDYIKKLSSITYSHVSLYLDSSLIRSNAQHPIHTRIDIKNSDNEYIASLFFERDDEFVFESKRMIRRFTILVIAILVISVFAMAWVFRSMIMKPFIDIFNSLNNNTPTPILKYLDKKNEVSMLAAAIQKGFLQNEELGLKYEEIKNLNEEIQAFNEELKMQNEEIQVLSQNAYEQKLIVERAETRLRNIMNNQGEGLFITNASGRIIFANPITYKVFETDEDEFLGEMSQHFFEPEVWERISTYFEIDNFNKISFEVYIYTPARIKKFLFFTSTADVDHEGNVIGRIFNFTDITDIKKEQEKIRELNVTLNKYFTAIEQSPVSIIFSDVNANIEYVNPFFTHITGYLPDEVQGKNPRILKSNNTSPTVYSEMWEQISNGKSWTGEFYNLKKNGDTFIEKTIILPLKNNAQEITGYMALKEDVTEIREAEKQLMESKHLIEMANERVMDSIKYASGIQYAMLPTVEFQYQILPQSFVFYEPKDMVSGDFFYIKQIRQFTVIAVADCTGHGVPGALMSMLSISLLNEIVTKPEYNTPAQILDELRVRIKTALNQSGNKREQRDGLDIALCIIDIETLELEYAGAYNPLWLYRDFPNPDPETGLNFRFIELTGDSQPVGIHFNEKPFTDKKIQLKSNDIFYLFSDGFASQFGGKNNQKMKRVRLRELLEGIHKENIHEQYELAMQYFHDWKSDNEQTDDVLLMGVRISY